MNALLRAIAKTWLQADAPHLTELVNAICNQEPLTSQAELVPAALKQDYDQAITSLIRFPDLQRELSRIGSRLMWMQGSMKMPETFQGKFAYVELAGPLGMITSNEVSFGLYLQQRETVYPSHWHCAVEDYLVISGTALWQIGDEDFVARPPGSHIVHASNQPHATTTLQDPLLAMWFWRGDIRDSTYRIVGVDS